MKRSGSAIEGKRYFDEIAPKYDYLRGREIWSSLLSTIGSFDHKGSPVLDIATGTGLFSVRLAAQGFHVLGLDRNPRMLMQAMRKAREQHCSFQAVLGSAEQLPLLGNSIAVMFSTNAVHHFDIREHFREVQRVLRPGGYYVVYTRFREQNARSIWGRFFPHFSEKEIRLYKPEHFERLDQEFPELALESLDEFSFEKPFSRDRLLQVARQRKYSTFALYSEAEFRQAYATFSSRLKDWSDKFYLAEMGRIVFRRR